MVTDFLSLEAYGFLRDFIVDRSYSAFLSFTSIVLRFGLGCPASGNDADNAMSSAAAVALAWLLHRQPHVLPIPGTRRLHHLQQNLAASALVLPAPVVQALDTLFAPGRAQGERYPDAGWAGVETR